MSPRFYSTSTIRCVFRHQGRQGLSSGGCLLVTSAKGAGSSTEGGGLLHPELAGEKHLGSEEAEEEEASLGDSGTRVGTAPRVLAFTPAGRTNAMSPLDSLVGTKRTPDPGPAVNKCKFKSRKFFIVFFCR